MTEPMTHQEYEALYAEALRVIQDKIVGIPETTPTGVRYVQIDGEICTDEDVFAQAWDRETARDIMRRKWSSSSQRAFVGCKRETAELEVAWGGNDESSRSQRRPSTAEDALLRYVALLSFLKITTQPFMDGYQVRQIHGTGVGVETLSNVQ